MGFSRSIIAVCLLAAVCGSLAAAPVSSVTLEGTVLGEDGEPLPHVAVFIYSAALKKGFALVCPTCWIDCGKHTETDDAGHFALDGVSPDLKFRLFAAKDGYSTGQKGYFDAALGPITPIKLKLRPTPEDPRMLLRGRLLTSDGRPVAGALIEPMGGLNGAAGGRYPPQFDLLAVSNETGEFNLIGKAPYDEILFKVSPRGLAPLIAVSATGEQRRSLTATPGATVMGQLVRQNGTPVANVEVILVNGQDRQNEEHFGDMRVGTDRDGKFAFTNVPAGFVWQLFTGQSVAALNLATPPRWCETHADGEIVHVGKISLTRAFTVKGRVIGAEAQITQISLGGDGLQDPRVAPLSADGRFEFSGLSAGAYQLWVGDEDTDPIKRPVLDLLVDHDRTDVQFRAVPVVRLAH